MCVCVTVVAVRVWCGDGGGCLVLSSMAHLAAHSHSQFVHNPVHNVTSYYLMTQLYICMSTVTHL